MNTSKTKQPQSFNAGAKKDKKNVRKRESASTTHFFYFPYVFYPFTENHNQENIETIHYIHLQIFLNKQPKQFIFIKKHI